MGGRIGSVHRAQDGQSYGFVIFVPTGEPKIRARPVLRVQPCAFCGPLIVPWDAIW